MYEELARRAYARELARVTLKLNDRVPSIVKRFEMAFKEKGLASDKDRPARLLLTEMVCRPAELVDAPTKARLQRLFARIVKRMANAAPASG